MKLISKFQTLDSTGAGDAFAGAFLVEFMNTKCIEMSLLAGCLAGACAVSVIGASTFPSDELFDSLLHSHSNLQAA